MNNDYFILLNRVADAWNHASHVFGIKLVAPFVLHADGVSVDCIAFLPEFGSKNGMVVGLTVAPDFDTDPDIVKCAERAGLFYTFLNAERYSEFHEERFKEALIDWGFFGATVQRPEWLR